MEVKDGQVQTYESRNGTPIIRKCGNCKFWQGLNGDVGYCQQLPLMFAYSLQFNMFATTPKFTLCDKHLLKNEELLKADSKSVLYDAAYMKKNTEK